jgi:hypothetical protein
MYKMLGIFILELDVAINLVFHILLCDDGPAS